MSEPKELPFSLPAPEGGSPDLLLIAGEHSGDEHAARAVAELRALQPGLRICAVGGPALAATGVQLLHDLTATSVVGFVEVLKHFGFYRAMFHAAVRWIEEHRPRAVCLVDYPGFNLRLAAELHRRGLSRKAGGPVQVLYYISPQIWAWKAGRRFQMAEWLDALAVIFPFEVQSYADTTLPVTFVGHPFVRGDEPSPVHYDPRGPVLLLPGSRRQAVARIFPALLDAYLWYRGDKGDREAVVIYPSEEVLAVLRRFTLVPFRAVKSGDPVGAAAVLTSSGTMSMRCALAGIPGAIAYRTNPFTYVLARRLARVPCIGIANLLLQETMYPEFIQGMATPAPLGAQLHLCLTDRNRIARTREQAGRLRNLLNQPAEGGIGVWLAERLADNAAPAGPP